jgi:hypothetical protein
MPHQPLPRSKAVESAWITSNITYYPCLMKCDLLHPFSPVEAVEEKLNIYRLSMQCPGWHPVPSSPSSPGLLQRLAKCCPPSGKSLPSPLLGICQTSVWSPLRAHGMPPSAQTACRQACTTFVHVSLCFRCEVSPTAVHMFTCPTRVSPRALPPAGSALPLPTSTAADPTPQALLCHAPASVSRADRLSQARTTGIR